MYTKEPNPTDKKEFPSEPETIPEEFKVRPHADGAEQLSLLSAQELAELERPSDSRSPQEGQMRSSDTAGARRGHRPKGGAIQDTLWPADAEQ